MGHFEPGANQSEWQPDVLVGRNPAFATIQLHGSEATR